MVHNRAFIFNSIDVPWASVALQGRGEWILPVTIDRKSFIVIEGLITINWIEIFRGEIFKRLELRMVWLRIGRLKYWRDDLNSIHHRWIVVTRCGYILYMRCIYDNRRWFDVYHGETYSLIRADHGLVNQLGSWLAARGVFN